MATRRASRKPARRPAGARSEVPLHGPEREQRGDSRPAPRKRRAGGPGVGVRLLWRRSVCTRSLSLCDSHSEHGSLCRGGGAALAASSSTFHFIVNIDGRLVYESGGGAECPAAEGLLVEELNLYVCAPDCPRSHHVARSLQALLPSHREQPAHQ
uniref:Uncharacterized protein n=1 Tax=Pipistrellus kuhlii TaxID=59472 RepID=A0A7J7VMD4_PIPKU|nr:hypothetical protein mPipKuh1_008385 [Pipistrellus kuhlii]